MGFFLVILVIICYIIFMSKKENIIYDVSCLLIVIFTLVSLVASIVFVIVFLDQVLPETISIINTNNTYEEVEGKIENYKENLHYLGREGSFSTYDYDIVWKDGDGKEYISKRRKMDYKPDLTQTIFYNNGKTVVEHSKSWYKKHLFLILRTEFIVIIILIISLVIRYIADKVIDKI